MHNKEEITSNRNFNDLVGMHKSRVGWPLVNSVNQEWTAQNVLLYLVSTLSGYQKYIFEMGTFDFLRSVKK